MFGSFVAICVVLLAVSKDVVQAELSPSPQALKLHKSKLSWEDADLTCQKEGGILASPVNDVILNAMKSLMGKKNTTYFIGMKSAYFTGPFVSVEGVSLDNISPAGMDMIDAIDQLDGDCLAMNSDSIRAVPCWSRLPFMCYNIRSLNTTSNYTRCGTDDKGYKYFAAQRRCYKLHSDKMTWWRAEQTCVDEGAHLVVLDDESEAQAVRDIFKSDFYFVWNGIRDHGHGDWRSVYGQRVEELFNVWFSNEMPKTKEQCGGLNTQLTYGWNDCDRKSHPFICEIIPGY